MFVDPDDYDPQRPPEDYAQPSFGSRSLHPYGTLGLHWVGDLALEGDVQVQGESGELLLSLVKAGTSLHLPHRCGDWQSNLIVAR